MKFTFGLQHPLTCNPSTTLSNPCNKERGKNIIKEVFLSFLHTYFIPASFLPVSSSCVFLDASFIIVSVFTQYIYICVFLHESADDNATPREIVHQIQWLLFAVVLLGSHVALGSQCLAILWCSWHTSHSWINFSIS